MCGKICPVNGGEVWNKKVNVEAPEKTSSFRVTVDFQIGHGSDHVVVVTSIDLELYLRKQENLSTTEKVNARGKSTTRNGR